MHTFSSSTSPGLTRLHRKGAQGFTLVEVMLATAILALTAVSFSVALLGSLRQATSTKILNLAKAEALSRVQEVGAVNYNPTSNPAVVPSVLAIGSQTFSVDLGDLGSSVGSVPGTVKMTVSAVANPRNVPIRRVLCEVDYNYQKRAYHYEVTTFRSPD